MSPRLCENCGKPLVSRPLYRKDGRIHSRYMPKRFCSKECTSIFNCKSSREAGRGRGWCLDKNGYVLLTKGRRNGYMQPQHRKIMEDFLGRKLLPTETVHHKNGIRHDNRLENLELWSGRHGRGQRASDLIADLPFPAYHY